MVSDNIILCFSGGLDSMIAWYYLGKPKCIFFHCSKYSETELNAVLRINPNTIISDALNLKTFEYGDNAYIPHRNILFAAIASNYSNNIVIAGVKDDVVEDKNSQAFDLMSNTLTSTSKKTIYIDSPFWNFTKSEIVKWFIKYVPDAEELIKLSTSCYNGQRFCGKCPSCFRKACSLNDNGIFYEFTNNKLIKQYHDAAIQGEYIESRNISIKHYISESLARGKA